MSKVIAVIGGLVITIAIITIVVAIIGWCTMSVWNECLVEAVTWANPIGHVQAIGLMFGVLWLSFLPIIWTKWS